MDHPIRLIIIGFFLVSIGLVLPVLMIMQTIPSTFLLAFVAHISSTGGLALGLIGSAAYVSVHRG